MIDVIYISKPLTRGKALDFASTQTNPLVIVREYANGKNRSTKYFIFVKVVPKDKVVLQHTNKVKARDVKEIFTTD
jgi:hypothetical protein